MKSYQYQIIRYLHDRVTGEFINLGVVVYAADMNFLKSMVLSKYGRITAFFAGADGKGILKSLKQFDNEIKRCAKEGEGLIPLPKDLFEITNKILPRDDSALYLTDVKKGIDLDMDRCLSEMFRLFVDRWQIDPEEATISDADVWKDKYKKYFDQYGITNRLTDYEVGTQHDTFVFDKAWKNEIWHCYQPLSFDLKHSDSIKDKVYKWSGRIREIKTSDEKIDLTFLASISHKHRDLSTFINDTLLEESDNISVNIVYDDHVESFAKNLLDEMNSHQE